MKPLTFKRLRKANVTRCEKHFHPLDSWSNAEWACALAGEVGELCNFIKKLKRLESKNFQKTKAYKDQVSAELLRQECGKEIGDIQAYLDLIAARMGFELDKVTSKKFNEVSKRVGSKIKL